MRFQKMISLALTASVIAAALAFSASAATSNQDNSWYVDNQNTNSLTDGNPFVCLTGSEGNYTTALGNRYQFNGTNYAWTSAENAAPWVGPWFISATTGADGVVAFVAPKNGPAEVRSQCNLKLDNADSDGLQFIIVQKSTDEKYYPLYPNKGSWEWKTIDASTTEITLSSISTYLNSGDEILYIVKSTGTSKNDTLDICPEVAFDLDQDVQPSGAARPTAFTNFNGKADTPTTSDTSSNPETPSTSETPSVPVGNQVDVITSNSSWFINNQTTNNETDNNPFVCLKGYDGAYSSALTNRKDLGSGNFAWTDTGEKQPWVGPWFMSATTKTDGVVKYVASDNGYAEVKSTIPLKLETSGGTQSDGLKFMIVQKSGNQYYPLFPSAGKWEWQNFDYSTAVNLSGVKTYLKKGDEILYVVRSTGTPNNDTLSIDPQIVLGKGAAEGNGYMYPAKFTAWNSNAAVVNGDTTKNVNTGDTPIAAAVVLAAVAGLAAIVIVKKK